MSHVSHIHMYEWVMSHITTYSQSHMSHVSCMNESCLTYPHVWMSHVSHIHFRSRAERRNLRRKEKYAEMDRKYAKKVRELRCLYVRFEVPKMCSRGNRWQICRKNAATEVCLYVQFDMKNVLIKKEMDRKYAGKVRVGFCMYLGFCMFCVGLCVEGADVI